MRLIRPLLAAFTGCWILVAIANMAVVDGFSAVAGWRPEVVSLLALGSAVCSFSLAVNPRAVLPFRVGGTFAIGTLCARVASIVLGTLLHGGTDAPWYTAAALGVVSMLAILYWRWWLTDVKIWHEAYKHLGASIHDRR